MTQQTDSVVNTWTLFLAQDAAPPTAKAAEPVPVGVPVAGGAPTQPGTGTAPAGQAPRPAPSGAELLWPFLVMAVVIILMTTLTGRKERKRRQELMASLKKHDKVVTSGGIVGTVVELSDDEAVLRVEEGRVRILRSAIAQVLKAPVTSAEKPATVGAS